MVKGYRGPRPVAADRCRMTTSHQPMGYPWALTATCDQPRGHHNLEGAPRVHRQRVEGHLVLWTTEPDLPSV